MASLQAEKPVESQSSRQVKKEPAKPSGSTPKAPSSKPAPKKTQKRSQPKQKAPLLFKQLKPPPTQIVSYNLNLPYAFTEIVRFESRSGAGHCRG
ncbi:hypothetical protein HKD37_01G001160 [Glycine soja]